MSDDSFTNMRFTLAEVPLPCRLRPEISMSDEEIGRFSSANEIIDLERTADGWLELRPIADTQTGGVIVDISVDLRLWNRDEGVVLANVGFTLPDGSLLCPTAAWIDHVMWDTVKQGDLSRFPVCAPYFLIEVVSWSRTLAMLQAKMALWITNGVRLAWLVNPDSQSVTIYRSGRKAEVIATHLELARLTPRIVSF